MGCCSSATPVGFNVDAGAIRATRVYFELGELPVSVKAVHKADSLEVQAVGLAQVGLLAALERGFSKRRFLIADATASARKGLFVGLFELKPFNETHMINSCSLEKAMSQPCKVDVHKLEDQEPRTRPAAKSGDTNDVDIGVMHVATSLGRCSQNAARLSLESEPDARTLTPEQLAKVDAGARKDGATVRLMILHDWGLGLRHALAQVVNSYGFKIVLARISLARSCQRCTIKDTLWLAPSAMRGRARSTRADSAADDSTAGRPRSSSTESAMECEGSSSPQSSSLAQLLGAISEDGLSLHTKDQYRGSQIDLDLNAEFDRQASWSFEELPRALRVPASGLPYHLSLDLKRGVQFEGLEKFVGAGMNTTVSEGEHVLEFSTYFVAAPSPAKASSSWFGSWGQGNNTYAEFVTQFHPTKHCWTIFKVFLNSVLPSGKKAGVNVAAEQLLTIPVAGAREWDGEKAVRDMREIVLCDVVNWNTYVLLSKVGRGPDSETERWLLGDELSASGLTLADLKTKSVEEIFAKTALGKLVVGILGTWRAKGHSRYSIQKVEVILDHMRQEFIFGEYRTVMDVTITLGRTEAMTNF